MLFKIVTIKEVKLSIGKICREKREAQKLSRDELAAERGAWGGTGSVEPRVTAAGARKRRRQERASSGNRCARAPFSH